jgi:hypothetical protein
MTSGINPLTATAAELQTKLNDKSITSKQLVKLYLDQIARYDGYLKAVIATAPQDTLERTAAELDDERAKGKIRGPLHGIPILIKVESHLYQTSMSQYTDTNLRIISQRLQSSVCQLPVAAWPLLALNREKMRRLLSKQVTISSTFL